MFTRITNFLLAVRSALYDAAGRGPRLANWSAPARSPNAIADNHVTVRARAEAEARNNPWAHRIVESLLAAIVGASGINPLWPDKTARTLWLDWADQCDAAGKLDWVGLLCLVLETVVISGECFVRIVIEDGARVPLKLQALGPEFLDASRTGKNTVAGVEYQGIKPVGYWLYQQRPSALGYSTSVYVPASEVVHIYRPPFPGAGRGVSWLAAALIPLRELQEASEAILVRLKVSALMTVFVRSDSGTNPLQPNSTTPSLEPGSVVRLQNGESIEAPPVPDAGVTVDPFIRATLRKIAAALSMPYELLSGDYSQVTFASGKAALAEFRRHIERIQYAFLIPGLVAPIVRRWLALAKALELLPEDTPMPRIVAPPLSMLDEAAETRNTVARIRAGLISRTEAIAMTGWAREDVDREIAAERAQEESLGLVFDTNPSKVTQQGQGQTVPKQPEVTNEK